MFHQETDRVIDHEDLKDQPHRIQLNDPCRGFYGSGYGFGYSPYTSLMVDFSGRYRWSQSPYTKFGPAIYPSQRRFGFGESPYTRNVPMYSGRLSSGESPYTDFGPFPC